MNAAKTHLTRQQTRFLHAVVRQNGLTDAQYRDLLQQAAGVRSSKELLRTDFDKVLALMADIGLTLPEPTARRAPDYGERPGMATQKQLQYLAGLRTRVFGPENPNYRVWLHRYFKISHERFMTAETASKVIEALKAMDARTTEEDQS